VPDPIPLRAVALAKTTAVASSNAKAAKRSLPSNSYTKLERAFLPAALEIIESPPSPSARLTALTICGLLVAGLTWSILAHVDMVAVAPGRVVPLGQSKVVQPLETSAIRAIYVDDGDHVKAGQALVDLDPTDVTTDLEALRYDSGQAALDAEVAQLLVTMNPDEVFHAPADVDPALVEANHQLAMSTIRQFLARQAEAQAGIAQKQAAVDVSRVAVDRAKKILPLLKEKDFAISTLERKGFGSHAAARESAQGSIDATASVASAETSKHQAEADVSAAEAKLQETIASYLLDASNRRSAALQKLAALSQQIAKLQRRQSYRHLVAPVAGTVQDVRIHTPGAIVTSADTLMTIVPEAGGIEIDAFVDNQDIGFVHEGQDVEIKFDAFPFTRYGLVKGRVRKLGRDAAVVANDSQRKLGSSEMAYSARISLDRDWIDIDSIRQSIQPGMRVAAEIRTGQRRVIDYVLSPVMQTVTEAARER
jgi:hemolysin D